jgi:hypothetical protein
MSLDLVYELILILKDELLMVGWTDLVIDVLEV